MNGTNPITQAFTELAPSYIKTMDRELIQFWGISYANFVEQFVKAAAVKPHDRVLDIATGTAVIPLKLCSMNQRQDQLVGLDITPAMLMQGRKLMSSGGFTPKIDLVCASAMEMPFEGGIFDVVICALGTHHMNVPKMLQEARRMLAKNGRLLITDVGATPFWRSPAGRVVLRLLMWQYGLANRSARSQAEIEAFKNVRTGKEWCALLEEYGFVKVRIDEIKPRLPWFPSGLTLQAEIAT